MVQSLLHALGIFGRHSYMPSTIFKLPGSGLELQSQSCGIQLPSSPYHLLALCWIFKIIYIYFIGNLKVVIFLDISLRYHLLIGILFFFPCQRACMHERDRQSACTPNRVHILQSVSSLSWPCSWEHPLMLGILRESWNLNPRSFPMWDPVALLLCHQLASQIFLDWWKKIVWM